MYKSKTVYNENRIALKLIAMDDWNIIINFENKISPRKDYFDSSEWNCTKKWCISMIVSKSESSDETIHKN